MLAPEADRVLEHEMEIESRAIVSLEIRDGRRRRTRRELLAVDVPLADSESAASALGLDAALELRGLGRVGGLVLRASAGSDEEDWRDRE
jgi:hypothetical protein